MIVHWFDLRVDLHDQKKNSWKTSHNQGRRAAEMCFNTKSIKVDADQVFVFSFFGAEA